MPQPQNALRKGTRDMTQGSIVKQVILFALPLMVGNVFQLLYNTADSVVLGQFVSKEALAAVGATTMIVNMLVFFFNGFATGAGVIIGQHYGARQTEKLHTAIETTMLTTFILSVIFTVAGVLLVRPMLHFMDTPIDVFEQATVYLQIYIAGISGLLIYNIASGILRAVGNSTWPLVFLIFTSLVNIGLDLLFVLGLGMKIEGVAIATVISQGLSAVLTLLLLTFTKNIYRMSWRDLRIHWPTLGRIFAVGLPAGIQSILTAFSNVFVQSYINFFGSDVMAGFSCYNKLDQFAFLPIQSMAMAATTFVSQNIGAKQYKRANRGTVITVAMSAGVTAAIVAALYLVAEPAVAFFSPEAKVIEYGALFITTNSFFLIANAVNHSLAGALRGRRDSVAPMIIMIVTFVGVRQLYLYLATRLIGNTVTVVGLAYPVGWCSCCIAEVAYYFLRWGRKRTE